MAEKKTNGAATPQNAAGAAKEQISKKEAVRRSLARLGKDAMPVDIQADIREQFGIEMGTGHISTTKGELRRAAREKKHKGAKQAAKPEAKGEPAAPPSKNPAAIGNGKQTVEMQDI